MGIQMFGRTCATGSPSKIEGVAVGRGGMTGGGIARYLSLITYHASLVIVFALYVRCILFSYIGLDDAAYTFRNPFVAGGLSVSNVVEAFTNLRHGGIWMPVTYVSYMLDSSICRWTGLPLMGEMHFVNVILHVVNFMLLWKLMVKLFGASALEGTRWANGTTETTGTDGTSRMDGTNGTADCRQPTTNTLLTTNHYTPTTLIIALAAMIWAVHPLRAEPVAWIAARKELLWTLFTLAGLVIWIRGMGNGERGTGNGETSSSKLPTTNYQLSTLGCCALACLSKPTAMCFPFLLLLVTWWMRKEGKVGEWVSEGVRDGGEDTRQATDVPCAKSQLHNNSPRLCDSALKTNPPSSTPNSQLTTTFYPLSLIPCHLIIAAATAAIAAYSQTHVAGQDVVALYAAPISHRLVNALSAIGYYLRATFWPFGLHVDCRAVPGLWPLDAGWNFAALAIAAVVAFLYWIQLRRKTFNHVERVDRVELLQVSTRSTRFIIFSALWFLVSLSPTLGIFGSFGMEAHADRFAYLPSMAFSFLLAGFLGNVAKLGMADQTLPPRQGECPGGARGYDPVPRHTPPASGHPLYLRGGVCTEPSTLNSTRSTRSTWLNPQLPTHNSQLSTLIVILLLSLVTFQQLSYWRDDWTAQQRVLDSDPEHPRAMVQVADVCCSRQRDFDGGIRLYRKALSRAGTVPKGGFNVADVKARLAYALASRGGYDDFAEVKRIGADVLRDFRLDRRGMMLDALGTAFMAEGDFKRAALLFTASIDAPDRFWPKASTRRKLEKAVASEGGF